MHYAVVGRLRQRGRAPAGRRRARVRSSSTRRPTTRCSDLVVSQDLGSLRLAGKGDWIRAFNILALKDSHE